MAPLPQPVEMQSKETFTPFESQRDHRGGMLRRDFQHHAPGVTGVQREHSLVVRPSAWSGAVLQARRHGR